MSSLSRLVELDAERRRSNLAKLRAMSSRLDDPLFSDVSPSPDPASERASRSTPTREPDHEPDGLGLLPRRTTHGGAYGDSILDRVLASYGIE